VVRATRAELPGANLIIAGLGVTERSAKQLARTGVPIVIATDGSLKLPPSLPRNVEVRRVDAAAPDAGVEALIAAEPHTVVVAGDVFRRQGEAWSAGQRIVDARSRGDAEDAVFADLLRGDLGLIARHINKKISFRITRYVLCHLKVTPNQVTLGAAALGFLGCVFLASGNYWTMAFGLVLAQLQSVLDGCDGELARVRFQQSAIGEWLDSLMDDFLNLCLVAALGIGMWRHGWGSWAAFCGGLTATMFLIYNLVSYRELRLQGVGGELLKIRWKINGGRDMKALWATPGGISRTRKIVLTLGRRDTFVFAWLVLGILNLYPVILGWAFLVALPCVVTAIAQLVMPAVAPTS